MRLVPFLTFMSSLALRGVDAITGAIGNFRLLESGDKRLLESGDKRLLE